jgi:Cd2+/Zn2+-exporting ATPase
MASNGCCDSMGCGKAEAPATATDSKASSEGKGGSGEHSRSQRNACAHGEDITREESTLCLAVVRENGTDIVLLDATGIPKTFRYEKNISDLCFKPHGSIDGSFLTPCLDEEGKHGVPEESCFCGVETPHMHAHLRAAHCDEACDDPAKLATHILHPLVKETEPERSLLNIDVSEAMPNECNSQALFDTKSSNGSCQGGGTHRRRMHAVQHEDHVDYLVHNAKTGNLHLEHPCDGCGHDDVHGTFQNIGQRQWKHRRDGKKDIQVHFFEIAPAKFNILDHLKIFSLESDRVKAVDNIMDSPSRRPSLKKSSSSSKSLKPELARSVLVCNGICCAAEIPIINRILEPIKGVKKVRVNVPLKQILVDYDATQVSAKAMTKALNVENLAATIKRDGGLAMESQPVTGKSTFYVEHICCASEIPAINQIVEPITGVSVITINVTTKTVYVTHNTQLVSAQEIRDALNKQGFAADIRKDAAQSLKARSVFCETILSMEGADEEASSNLVSVLTMFLRNNYDPTQIQMESFIVDLPQKEIKVVHNPFSVTAQCISSALFTETGIQTIVRKDGADPSSWDLSWLDDSFKDDEQMVSEPNTYPKPAVVLSGVCWLVSMLSLAEGNLTNLKWVGLASVAFGLPAIAIKAIRTMARYQFDTNCLMLFAACGAVALQEYTEAAALVFLFAISEWLEVRATARARHALSAIVHLRPEKANLVHPQTRQLVVIPASAVPVGALVSVKTGDKIPCDGIVVEGTTTVDESSLTGEARPIRKGLHDVVSGGTVNSGMTQIMVRTTSTSENSAVSRLIRLVEEAQANRSDTEKLVDEFAKIYTPFVVLAAVLMCSVPWAFGQETGRTWTENGLILIVVACPCAMIISTPVSYVAGLAATAQNGILIKGGAHLEALSLVKHICFDKTGTLTNGEFALLSLEDFAKNMSRKEVFEHLALMEERASHPVAQAILTGARNEKVSIPKDTELERHTIVAGEGVLGIINGREVHVGNERMFGRIGLLKDVPETVRAKVESWKGLGGTIGYMSIEGEGIVCAYCAADGVRAESASVLSRLRKCGIEVTMLTGDNRDAALAVGAQVGLSEQEIQSKLLPEEKLAFIESLSSGRTGGSILSNPCGQRRLVMMCGDGVNDAPALAAADIGVAMGAGAALAMETADIALLDSNLEKLEYSIKMGQKVIRKIKENVIFSLTVKAVVLAFAAVGKAYLWAAIGSDVGAMILVTLNAMLLLPRRQGRADITKLQDDIENGTNYVRSSTTLGYGSMEDGDEQKPFVFEWAKSARACNKECCSEPTLSKCAGAINKADILDSGKPCESSKMAEVRKVIGVDITRGSRKAHSSSTSCAEQYSDCHPDQGTDALESDALLLARP